MCVKTTAGIAITIQAPQLDINTVAAGGGSRFFYRGGLFVVGPESASAHPGPVCYKKGSQLAITDANLLLGRVLPDFFPHIFGPAENEPLDTSGVKAAFENIRAEINAETTKRKEAEYSLDQVAAGFIKVSKT